MRKLEPQDLEEHAATLYAKLVDPSFTEKRHVKQLLQKIQKTRPAAIRERCGADAVSVVEKSLIK